MSATVGTNEQSTGAVVGDVIAAAVTGHPSAVGDSGQPWRSRFDTPVWNAVAVVVLALSGVALFWFIHHFAVNIIYYDQWTDINVIDHAHSGTLTFGTLWAQHNENRIFFPNLVVLALGATTHYDVIVEDFIGGVLWCGTAALIIAAHKRRSPGVPLLYYCPVAVVLLSFIPAGDALFGFNLSWFMVTVTLAATLFLLDRPSLTRLVLAGAVLAAVIGSYSSLQGLLIWPTGLVLLVFRHRTRRVVAGWIAAAAVAIVLYFIGFNFAATGGSGSPLAHPLTSLEFFFSLMGNVFGASLNGSPNAVNGGPLALGVVVFLIAGWGVVRTVRSDRPAGRPVGVALICFGVLFALSTTFGRQQFGLPSTSRYSIFTLTIWIGAFLALLGPPAQSTEGALASVMTWLDRVLGVADRHRVGDETPSRSPLPRSAKVTWLAQLVLVILLVVQVGAATGQGLLFARAWHDQELTMADVEANIDRAPNGLILATLGAYPTSFVRPLARFAQAQHLGLYNSGLYAQDRRSGLASSLVTQVLSPANRAVLSGTKVIWSEAYLSDPHDAVEFRVSGNGLHGKIVAHTYKFLFNGWFLAEWNTTNVPDGVYQLRSVVVRPHLTPEYSPPVTIQVDNGH
jgi:hypothetical protein